ncbi:MAG: ABC transporter permease [Candidatus Cloacimonetes bacterium]|nr:ABC transporter permease [Candidatus Cloacimonadota bacterium]
MFGNYLKIAYRNLMSNKFYTLINIIGLSIGFSCAILILLFIRNELGYDKFHSNYKRIFRVESKFEISGQEDKFAVTARPLAPTMAAEFPEIESYVRFAPVGKALFEIGNSEFYDESFYMADSTALTVFSLSVIRGDAKSALTEPFTMVINESFASKWYGNENPIGKIIRLDKDRNYTVTAVIKDLPDNVHLSYNGLISMQSGAEIMGEEDFNSTISPAFWQIGLFSYILLRENSDISSIKAGFPVFYDKYMKPVGEQINATFEPMFSRLDKIQLSTNLPGDLPVGSILYVYIFAVVGIFILLIASINYMNIATARSVKRAREVGLRKVFGSTQANLRTQFLFESIIISLLSLIVACAVSELLTPVFNEISGREINLNFFDFSAFHLTFLLLAISVGLVSGSYPAFYLASFTPEKILKGTLTTGKKGSFFRKILVLIQFTISLIMITGTITVYKQLMYFQEKDLGFDKENLITFTATDSNLSKNMPAFAERILQRSDIKGIASTNHLPGLGLGKVVMGIEKDNEIQNLATNFFFVEGDFVDLMGMKIIKGRNFDLNLETDFTRAFLVNRVAAERFGWFDDALGKRIQFGQDDNGNPIRDGEVVGVVYNFHFKSLHNPEEPMVIMLSKDPMPTLVARINSSNPRATISELQTIWREINNDYPFEYQFVDDNIMEFYILEQKTARLFSYFAAICIMISCLGLFGLSSYTIEQKTKEIGIRKVMGAESSSIAFDLMKDFLKLVGYANVLAIPLAYFSLKEWLNSFAYHINVPLSSFVISGITAILIAVLTISYQAFKAANANPAEVMKYE